jgi:hypothetical protein
LGRDLSRGMRMRRPRIRRSHERFMEAFEEAGILQELTKIVDNVNGTLLIAERYRRGLPLALIRTSSMIASTGSRNLSEGIGDMLVRRWIMLMRSF